jgi:hypothetical protein
MLVCHRFLDLQFEKKKKKLIWIDLLTAFDINPRRHAFAKTSVRVAQKQVQTQSIIEVNILCKIQSPTLLGHNPC